MRIKQILIVLFIVIFCSVVSYRFGVLADITGSLKSIVEPGSMVTEASYVIFTDGTNVYARNGLTGEVEFQGTNASQVINNALDNLTSGRTWIETVILKGNFTIDSSLLVDDYTAIYLDGAISATYNPSFSMVRNTDQTNGNIYIIIHGGIWNGNCGPSKVANADIFSFKATSGHKCYDITIEHVKAGGAGDSVLKLAYVYQSIFYDIRQGSSLAHSRGSYMYAVLISDSIVRTVWGGSYAENFYLDSGGGNIIDDIYGGGSTDPASGAAAQIVINNMATSFLTNIRSDSSAGNGIFIGGSGCSKNQITGLEATRPLAAGKTAIWLYQCKQCQFSNIYIGQTLDDSGYDWAYGILEEDTADYNLISGVRITDCVTPYILVGANSRIMLADPKTENSGTATSITNGYWQPHGLASTPTIVTLTPRSNVVVWVIDRNVTHFQVGVSSGTVTVDWYAEV